MKSVKRLTGVCAAVLLVGLQGNGTLAAQRASQPAPAPVAASVCATRNFCIENASFAAVVADFEALLQGQNKTLTLRLSVKNKSNRPLSLGYVANSGVAVDERGNRYLVTGEVRGVQGIGQIRGAEADAKFTLQPGEASAGRFEFEWTSSGREIFGVTFNADLTLREIERLPNGQTRLGREYVLHYTGLANPASRTTAAPTASATPSAPTASPVQAATDACAGRARCYNAGPFAAEITALTPSAAGTATVADTVQTRVHFWNLTSRPVILGYVAGTAVMTDEFGGRYTVRGNSTDGAKGMGVVTRDEADSQFVLAAGAAGDATFTVSRTRGRNDRVGATFGLDLTIAQLEILPGNQVNTTREYSLGFKGLSAAAAGTTSAAPPKSSGAPSDADACGGKPRCYSAGPFVAEVTGLSSSVRQMAPPQDVLQAKVRFRNLSDKPLILGYVEKSAVITDDTGNRFTMTGSGDSAKGIGVVKNNDADTQFVLKPGASGDVTFQVTHSRVRNERQGKAFSFDLTIAHLEDLDSRQVRTVREYAVGFTNLTASGPSLLNRVLQGAK